MVYINYSSFKNVEEDTFVTIFLKETSLIPKRIVAKILENDTDSKVLYTTMGTFYYDKIDKIETI